ncbi:MAG: response regulator [Bacteroidetes bacterium]|nr:response regulator [Bacteroidota bacterium]
MSTPKYDLVMLIDDNELDNFVNKKMIEVESFAGATTIHPSAVSALEYLKKNEGAPELIPGLIFLDIMMPEMDGFGFLDAFDKLADAVKAKSKIVMLSTSDSFKDLNRANQNKHVKRFLNKPLSAQVLSALNI